MLFKELLQKHISIQSCFASMVRHDIHITPAPNGWKAAINESMLILTPTKKECMEIVFEKARTTGSVYVFVHKLDGSVQKIRYFK